MTDKRQQLIEVLPYNPDWSKEFKREAALIQQIFKKDCVAVYHIGSTAVPGLAAKPTIDILLEVKDIGRVDQCNDAMAKLGYEAWGEYHISGRRFFVKGEEKRTHHVHAFATDSNDIKRHLCFRDYLIACPDEAERYAQLKLKLAKKYRHNRRAYVENKQGFVREIEIKALAWCI